MVSVPLVPLMVRRRVTDPAPSSNSWSIRWVFSGSNSDRSIVALKQTNKKTNKKSNYEAMKQLVNTEYDVLSTFPH